MHRKLQHILSASDSISDLGFQGSVKNKNQNYSLRKIHFNSMILNALMNSTRNTS